MVCFLGSSVLKPTAMYMLTLFIIRHVLPRSLACAFLASLTLHMTTHRSLCADAFICVWAYANLGYDPGALMEAVA